MELGAGLVDLVKGVSLHSGGGHSGTGPGEGFVGFVTEHLAQSPIVVWSSPSG